MTRGAGSIADLPRGARVGTSSSRRRFQALRVNAGLEISPLRGNVDTRLQSVIDGKLDAIIVAVAGLKRLGRTDVAFAPLDEHQFIPAGGQGALAIETLIEIDGEIARALAALDNPRARYETTAERAFLATLGASCVTPVGIKATVSGSSIALRAMLFSNDGAHEMSDEIEEPIDATLPPAAAQSLGVKLGERMLANGGSARCRWLTFRPRLPGRSRPGVFDLITQRCACLKTADCVVLLGKPRLAAALAAEGRVDFRARRGRAA